MMKSTSVVDPIVIQRLLTTSNLKTKFINLLMRDGKKTRAESIVFSCFTEILRKTKKVPTIVLAQAVYLARPLIEVKSVRIGGVTYQVPKEIDENRQITLALRWLISASRKRSEKQIYRCLAAEILNAYKNEGNVIKKRDDLHRLAEANRAFSHFRWW